MIRFPLVAAAVVVTVSLLAPASARAATPVLKIARSFDDGGGYEWSSGSGAPHAIEFAGETILPAQEKGTYCSGFTFSVVMRAANERGLLEGKNADEIRRFQKEWYGVPKEAQEKQCVLAMERLGIGAEVKLSDAKPGDFVQIWRDNKSGHSVVLVELVPDGGRVVGLNYRSSQKSTDGIGDRVEFFADAPGHEGQVLRDRTFVGRLADAPR